MANKFAKDNEAVSAVIGVILMVAITVILAAVIAAFVFGMGSSVKKTYVVACTASRVDASSASITYNGGTDASKLTGISATCNGVDITTIGGSALTTGVGSTSTFTATKGVQGDHIVVVGTFGTSQQVILDTYV